MDKTAEMSGKRGARDAILDAFRDIVLGGGYDGVRVRDIVERSGIARSTFYEHFQSREDVLRDSMRRPLHALAQLAAAGGDVSAVAFVLEHFAQNSRMALGLMQGESASVIRALLGELIERASPRPAPLAHAIAGAQLALVCRWLEGKDAQSAHLLAQTLSDVTVALTGLHQGTGTKLPKKRRS